MKQRRISCLIGLICCANALAQYYGEFSENMKKQYAQTLEQERQEEAEYYAGADTACYAVRYLWTYLYNKEEQRVYKENRVVCVAPDVTLDCSYQPIGEKRSMAESLKAGKMVRDSSLAYRLTPSFYFYYPKEKRLKRTYRIVSEEFLLSDSVIENRWTLTAEEKDIAGHRCRKAYTTNNGRNWYAWYTTELPYTAAPRHLTGLPGVVLEASDEEGEIVWQCEGIFPCHPENRYYIKFPENLSVLPKGKFSLIMKLFALSTSAQVRESKVMEKRSKALPWKLNPLTGIDACRITNPIER